MLPVPHHNIINPSTPRRRKRKLTSPSKRYVRDGHASWNRGLSTTLPGGQFVYFSEPGPSPDQCVREASPDPFSIEGDVGFINEEADNDSAKIIRRQLYRTTQNKQRDNWNVVLSNGLMNEYCTYLQQTRFLAIQEVSPAPTLCTCGAVRLPCEVTCVYSFCKLQLTNAQYSIIDPRYMKTAKPECSIPVAVNHWPFNSCGMGYSHVRLLNPLWRSMRSC